MGLCSHTRGALLNRPLVSCGLVLIMRLCKLIKEDICAVAVFYIFAAWKKCNYHKMVLMNLKSIFFLLLVSQGTLQFY